MNLADAIRAATHGQPTAAASKPQPAVKAPTPPAPLPKEVQDDQPVSLTVPEPAAVPEEFHASVATGNVVRLELFLNPEQMANLMKSILAGQHSVMTLREAASYLRISAPTLQKLAEDGEIPGVQIDGKWRFPKPNLDDWLALRSAQLEDQNVA